MAPRKPTNTLILTQVDESLLQDPTPLLEFLSANDHLLELVALPKFQRILLICESTGVATKINDLLKSSKWGFRITYSIKDNHLTITDHPECLPQEDKIVYLELPSEVGSKRFLISPPLSPPAEWDHWDKVEDGPNNKAVYSPQELSHLLWERLGGFDSSDIRKYHGDEEDVDEEEVVIMSESEVLFKDIDNGVPAIVLDTMNNRQKGRPANTLVKSAIPKTSMPPPPE